MSARAAADKPGMGSDAQRRQSLKRSVLEALCRAADLALTPLTLVSAMWLKFLRRVGTQRTPFARRVFQVIGMFPIRDHYYEPFVAPSRLRRSLRQVRPLGGLDLDVPRQLALLERFDFEKELLAVPLEDSGTREFYYNNPAFGSGDAEFLYSVIRHFRPRRVLEIGSGFSTLLAARAIRRNREDDPRYACEHTCVEPYEMPWLESLGVRVIRERVECLGHDVAEALEENDILFIDSSHVIRPQGDVLFEYLELLPRLKRGVLIHVHDIFTPRDLPDEWISERVRFWNEQYLLEAFLSHNSEFRVLAALNHLKHDHFETLARKCPILRRQPEREPGSFWMVRDGRSGTVGAGGNGERRAA